MITRITAVLTILFVLLSGVGLATINLYDRDTTIYGRDDVNVHGHAAQDGDGSDPIGYPAEYVDAFSHDTIAGGDWVIKHGTGAQVSAGTMNFNSSSQVMVVYTQPMAAQYGDARVELSKSGGQWGIGFGLNGNASGVYYIIKMVNQTLVLDLYRDGVWQSSLDYETVVGEVSTLGIAVEYNSKVNVWLNPMTEASVNVDEWDIDGDGSTEGPDFTFTNFPYDFLGTNFGLFAYPSTPPLQLDNFSCSSYGDPITTDTVPPVVTIISPPGNIDTESSSIAVHGTAVDDSIIEFCKIRQGAQPNSDSGTLLSGTSSWVGGTGTVPEGNTTIYVGCKDIYDNWGYDSFVFTRSSPTPPPTPPPPVEPTIKFYVTQNGGNPADGSSVARAFSIGMFNNPAYWSTNPSATGKIRPGSTVYFSGTFSTGFNVAGSGTITAPIILDGWEGGSCNPVFSECTSSALITGSIENGILIEERDNIVVQDFRLKNVSGNGLRLPYFGVNRPTFPGTVNSINNITIRRCLVDGTGKYNMYLAKTDNLTLENNRFNDCRLTAGEEGNSLLACNDVVVRGNHWTRTNTTAPPTSQTGSNLMTVHMTHRALFEYNKWEGPIYPDNDGGGGVISFKEEGWSDIIFRKNIVRVVHSPGSQVRALAIGQRGAATSPRAIGWYGYANLIDGGNGSIVASVARNVSNVHLWSNLFFAGPSLLNGGMGMYPQDSYWPINIYFINNVFANILQTASGKNVGATGLALNAATNGVAKNNIFYRNRINEYYKHQMYVGFPDQVTLDGNHYHGGNNNQVAYVNGYKSIAGLQAMGLELSTNATTGVLDPKFTNASSNNFTLQNSSPCVNTGVTISDATLPNYQNRINIQGTTYCNNVGGLCDERLSYATALLPETDWTQFPSSATIKTGVQGHYGGWEKGAYIYTGGTSAPNFENLAIGKAVAATSQESTTLGATKAVDNNLSTRWSSAFNDNQSITVDLVKLYDVSKVVLRWEAAYGKAYQIQTSKDGGVWTTVYSTSISDGGIDDISFVTTQARYVRMLGIQRATQWGYSLFEIEVWGDPTSVADPPTPVDRTAPVVQEFNARYGDGVYSINWVVSDSFGELASIKPYMAPTTCAEATGRWELQTPIDLSTQALTSHTGSTYYPLSAGTYCFTVHVFDKAGNSGTTAPVQVTNSPGSSIFLWDDFDDGSLTRNTNGVRLAKGWNAISQSPANTSATESNGRVKISIGKAHTLVFLNPAEEADEFDFWSDPDGYKVTWVLDEFDIQSSNSYHGAMVAHMGIISGDATHDWYYPAQWHNKGGIYVRIGRKSAAAQDCWVELKFFNKKTIPSEHSSPGDPGATTIAAYNQVFSYPITVTATLKSSGWEYNIGGTVFSGNWTTSLDEGPLKDAAMTTEFINGAFPIIQAATEDNTSGWYFTPNSLYMGSVKVEKIGGSPPPQPPPPVDPPDSGIPWDDHGNLRVKSGGHFLEYEDGTPFFLMADTAWELMALSDTNIETYLDNRKARGFNTVQFCPGPTFFNGTPPKGYVAATESKWARVDFVVSELAERGMYALIVPLWGSDSNKRHWTDPYNHLYSVGSYISNRYKSKPNVLYCAAGEYTTIGNSEYSDYSTAALTNSTTINWIRRLGQGLAANASAGQLITLHGRLGPNFGSDLNFRPSDHYHGEGWIDFYGHQTWHYLHKTDNMILHDRGLPNPKPAFNMEPGYEGANYSPDNYTATPYGSRVAAWWGAFNGACGHSYGHIGFAAMCSNLNDPWGTRGTNTLQPASLSAEGGADMQHVLSLLYKNGMTYIPDQSFLVSGTGNDAAAPPTKVLAVVDAAKDFGYVYLSVGGSVTVNLSKIDHSQIHAYWYNPRSGEQTTISSSLPNSGPWASPSSPTSGFHNDWVLVFEGK